mmetsp:Transcript_38251/g.43168  ORF Transcript_38251/g.43168 Transcript_38251/m.43168 type:complete len:434 (+) Transcript_38251:79-1380(+)
MRSCSLSLLPSLAVIFTVTVTVIMMLVGGVETVYCRTEGAADVVANWLSGKYKRLASKRTVTQTPHNNPAGLSVNTGTEITLALMLNRGGSGYDFLNDNVNINKYMRLMGSDDSDDDDANDDDDDTDDDGRNHLYYGTSTLDLSKMNCLPSERSCSLFRQGDDEEEIHNFLVAAQYYKEAADSVQGDTHLFLDFYAWARMNQARCYFNKQMYEESVKACDQLLIDTAFILTDSGSNNNNKEEVSRVAAFHKYRQKAIDFRHESLLWKSFYNAQDAFDRDDDDRSLVLSKYALDDAHDCLGYGTKASLTLKCAHLYYLRICCHFRNQDYTVCKEECQRFLSETVFTSSWTKDDLELLQDTQSEALIFLEKCERLGDYLTLRDLEKQQQSSFLPADEDNGTGASISLHFLSDHNIKPPSLFLQKPKQEQDSTTFQ